MLLFTMENLRNVNRVVVRSEQHRELVADLVDQMDSPDDGVSGKLFEALREMIASRLTEIGVGRPDLHVSLFVGREQVALGAPRQTSRRNGEFTTDLSGLKLVLMFLEQITGQNFKSQVRVEDSNIEEYHRSDLRVVKMPKPAVS